MELQRIIAFGIIFLVLLGSLFLAAKVELKEKITYVNETVEVKVPVNVTISLYEPSDVVIVMDASGSMKWPDVANKSKMYYAKLAANSLVDLTGKNITLGVVTFGRNASVLVDLTDNKTKIKEKINQIEPELNFTAIGDAIEKSMDILVRGKNNKKVIVLFTDGRYNFGSDPNLVSKKASMMGINMYTIGYGKEADEELLRYIADISPRGKYYFAPTGVELKKLFEEIAVTKLKVTKIITKLETRKKIVKKEVITPVLDYPSTIVSRIALGFALFLIIFFHEAVDVIGRLLGMESKGR
ncbi:MAG: VWA domain-containing protein [Candidatus Hydrothermarchaeota archaeon]